jgi:hypothetical protein
MTMKINPNIEYLNSKQYQNSNVQIPQTTNISYGSSFEHLLLGNLNLFSASCLGFRITRGICR